MKGITIPGNRVFFWNQGKVVKKQEKWFIEGRRNLKGIGLIVLGIILLILGCNLCPSSFQIQVGTSILKFSDDNII